MSAIEYSAAEVTALVQAPVHDILQALRLVAV